MAEYKFFNRDISWLSFNHRVLEEAYNKKLPLYERIKFLAIFSNNLEEFYRVRITYYRDLIKTLPKNHVKIKEVKPKEILKQINTIVGQHEEEFGSVFYNEIIPELEKNNIYLLKDKFTKSQSEMAKYIFEKDIITLVQPILLVQNRIKPFLKTGHLYIGLQMYNKIGSQRRGYTKGSVPKYGLIKLPTDQNIPRFTELPSINNKHYIVFLEDLIMMHAHKLFPGYIIHRWYPLKVTRDADLEYDDFDQEDFIELIENIESTRALGKPNRFQYDRRMPRNMVNFLKSTLDVSNESLVKGGRTQNFRDFFEFPNPIAPKLELPPFVQLPIQGLEKAESILDVTEKKEFLLHAPYHKFDYFIQFLHEAAQDDTVSEIKTTVYRVAETSRVVEELILAADNGKKVTVFVELKARFDEKANLIHARKMHRSGIKIIYNLPGLKVHSKTAIVIRNKKVNRQLKDIAFLGTGNFNEKTAKLYADDALFTPNPEITKDIKALFNFLENQKKPPVFKHILVPNFNMVETYVKLIEDEINEAKKGRKARIIVKMNGLEDPFMISKLYEASQAGVKIDCIIRGICRLIPNQTFSKNITVTRIVDRFLEHTRCFVFYSKGENKTYLGSADWMKRNLYRRIECVFPIYDSKLKAEMHEMLDIQLNDSVSARHLNENNKHVKIKGDEKKIRSQSAYYDFLKDLD